MADRLLALMLSFIASHIEVIAPEAFMLALFGVLFAIPRTRTLAHRLVRCGKRLARDRDLPLWARYGYVVFSLPIPGPVDEIGAAVLTLALWRLGHGQRVRDHWRACNPARNEVP